MPDTERGAAVDGHELVDEGSHVTLGLEPPGDRPQRVARLHDVAAGLDGRGGRCRATLGDGGRDVPERRHGPAGRHRPHEERGDRQRGAPPAAAADTCAPWVQCATGRGRRTRHRSSRRRGGSWHGPWLLLMGGGWIRADRTDRLSRTGVRQPSTNARSLSRQKRTIVPGNRCLTSAPNTSTLRSMTDALPTTPPPVALTSRQREILEVIDRYMRERGYPPSVREIGEAVGLTSPSTVHNHLASLQRRGFLRRDPTKPRAIEVRWDPSSDAALERRPVRSRAARRRRRRRHRRARAGERRGAAAAPGRLRRRRASCSCCGSGATP